MFSALIVDDMAIFREPLEVLLRAEGFATRSAANGADALTLVNESIPDIVILDLSMPGLSGIGFLKQLRTNANTSEVPVIVLTAQDDPAQLAAIQSFRVEGLMLKSQFSAREIVLRARRAAARSVVHTPDSELVDDSSDQVVQSTGTSYAANARDARSRPMDSTLRVSPVIRLDIRA
jgi:DNA-binding NarL/FixJ family response regulator